MDGHPVGHGGAPAGIGAGVEAADEFNPGDATCCVATDAALHLGRVAFGGGGHTFAAAVDHAAGPASFQRHQPDQRLQGHIQLGAEPAASGRGQDAHTVCWQAKDGGGVIAVHHRGLSAGADAQNRALHPSRARLGFDIGVFDIGRLKAPFDDMGRRRQGRRRVTLADLALDQQVLGAARVQKVGVWCLSLSRGEERGQHRPMHWKAGQVGGCVRLKRHKRHAFTAKAGGAFGNGGLVGKGRDDGEGVAAGNVGGGEDSGHTRTRGKSGQIPEGKGGMGMRRADGLHHQGALWRHIGTEQITGDFGRAIKPLQPRPKRAAFQRCGGRRIAPGVTDRREDLAIAGAAAQHPAQRLFGLSLGRAGGGGQEFRR